MEHAKHRHGAVLCETLSRVLRGSGLEVPTIQGALRLAGHLAEPVLAPAIEACWDNDASRSQSIADYIWAFAHCCGTEPARYLRPVLDAWAALPDDSSASSRGSERASVAEYHLRWAFRRWIPGSAIPYFVERAADEALRFPITLLLHGIDRPAAVQFVVQELARIRHRLEGSDSFSPFVFSADDEWRRAQENGRPMSKASRALLAATWQSDSADKHARIQAFALWAATHEADDLQVLRVTQPSASDLGEAPLRARLTRGDATAIPALIQQLSTDKRGYWWQYARNVWSPELAQVLDAWLESRSTTTSRRWGEQVDADWLTSDILQRLPREDAEHLLVKHWDHLRLIPHFVQTALYVGTPKLVQLAEAAITECPTPAILFAHLGHAYGIRLQGHPGITREEQIRILGPYLHLLADIDRRALWDECNDHGWFSTRKELLDDVQATTWQRGWDRDIAFSEFDRLATDPNHFAWLRHVIDDFIETGVSWADVLAALTEWLAARQSAEALRVVGTALAYHGTRKDLCALNVYTGTRGAVTDNIIANTTFAVRRRSLH